MTEVGTAHVNSTRMSEIWSIEKEGSMVGVAIMVVVQWDRTRKKFQKWVQRGANFATVIDGNRRDGNRRPWFM